MTRALILLLLAAAPAAAQVISPAPDKVAVTIYRDPERSIDDAMELDDLGSFALIAETRTVELPPGVATIRFEGVAGGIIPQSAILFGGDIREKNRDAALLSQKGLIDAFTGQRVTLRRANTATGVTTTETALVRSGSNGMVLQTASGMEAVYCAATGQTVLFPEAPKTLSPKPVLSMQTRNQPGGRVTITLAYLATNFDWDATYIGTLSEDAKSLNLFAWLTMASGDETSFPDATAAAVAGTINREEDTGEDEEALDLKQEAEDFYPEFGCWPQGTTTSGLTMPEISTGVLPPAVMLDMDEGYGEIVVTGTRRMEMLQSSPITVAVTAIAESLGDLKLYRIPVPVTVAAQSQKQVAFLQKPKVKGRVIYRSRAYGDELNEPEMLFRFRNSTKNGAGDPLPAGKVAMFQPLDGRQMLVGEGSLPNKTVDEEVDVVFGEPSNVTVESENVDIDDKNDIWGARFIVRNANPHAISFEAEFRNDDYIISRASEKLIKRPGKRVWAVRVPGNSEKTLDFRYGEREEEEEGDDE